LNRITESDTLAGIKKPAIEERSDEGEEEEEEEKGEEGKS
jgi:hypothetical protein